MEKNTNFNMLIIFAMILVVAAGCRDNDYNKPEKIEENFYVSIELPPLQSEFTKGYPKDIEAKAYLEEKELNNHVDFIWHSDIDGNFGDGKVISTEYLSIGDHLITLNAYHKSAVAFQTVNIKKINVPDVEQNAISPNNRVIDRVDGTVYIDNQDGTVTDTTTQLMWEQADDGYRRDVYGAYQHCEELNLGGYKDWRMPTLSELEEIANIGLHKKEPIICRVFDNKNSSYWTQTKSSLKLRTKSGTTYYSSVDFVHSRKRNGLIGTTIKPADEYSQRYVRCVR